jgi:hypothetical protein
MSFGKSLAAAVAASVIALPSALAGGGTLSHLTISSWSSTITQVGGASTTYSSSDSSNWTGFSSPTYVSAACNPSAVAPYGYLVASESIASGAWDMLQFAGTGGGFSGPPANLTAVDGTFEVVVTAARGIRFMQEDFYFTATAGWSYRLVTDAFGTGTVLTTGMVLGPGTYAIDYVSTVSAESFSYSNAHFANVVPLPGAAAFAAAGLVASSRRRRR